VPGADAAPGMLGNSGVCASPRTSQGARVHTAAPGTFWRAQHTNAGTLERSALFPRSVLGLTCGTLRPCGVSPGEGNARRLRSERQRRGRRCDGSQPPLASEVTTALLDALDRDRRRRPENGAATATRRLTVRDRLQFALELDRRVTCDAQQRGELDTPRSERCPARADRQTVRLEAGDRGTDFGRPVAPAPKLGDNPA
jgi:hypothetical protein